MVFFLCKMSVKNILYLKEKDFVSSIVYIGKEERIYSVGDKVNKLAKSHFFSVKEYRKIARKELQLGNKIPIYFSNVLFLFYINAKNTLYWINYFMVLKICYDKNVIIFFKDGSFIEVEVSKKNFSNELKKINKVLQYVNNL